MRTPTLIAGFVWNVSYQIDSGERFCLRLRRIHRRQHPPASVGNRRKALTPGMFLADLLAFSSPSAVTIRVLLYICKLFKVWTINFVLGFSKTKLSKTMTLSSKTLLERAERIASLLTFLGKRYE
jgi:hypothetical protein